MVPPTVSRPITRIVSGLEMSIAGLAGSSAVISRVGALGDGERLARDAHVLVRIEEDADDLARGRLLHGLGQRRMVGRSLRDRVDRPRDDAEAILRTLDRRERRTRRCTQARRRSRAAWGGRRADLIAKLGTSPLKFVPGGVVWNGRAGREADGSGGVRPHVADAAEPAQRAGEGPCGDRTADAIERLGLERGYAAAERHRRPRPPR